MIPTKVVVGGLIRQKCLLLQLMWSKVTSSLTPYAYEIESKFNA